MTEPDAADVEHGGAGTPRALRAIGVALQRVPRPAWAAVAAGWVALSWILSSQTLDDVPGGVLWHFLSNGMHVPLFGLLALWLALALPRAGDWPRLTPQACVGVVLAVSAYGAVDEWHQSWSGRSATWTDWLTDTIAATWVVVVALEVGRPRSAKAGSSTSVSLRFWGGMLVCLGAVALATWA